MRYPWIGTQFGFIFFSQNFFISDLNHFFKFKTKKYIYKADFLYLSTQSSIDLSTENPLKGVLQI